MLQAIMGTTALGIVLVTVIYEKPPTPPSAAAVATPTPFKESLVTVLKNVQFLKLLVLYGLMNTLFGCALSLISQWASSHHDGYTTTEKGIFNVSFLAGGVIGSYIVGPLLDKTKAYKKFCTIIPICAMVFLTILNYTFAL